MAIYELTGGETSIVNPEMDSDTDYEAAKRTISQDNARAWKALDKISLRLKGKKEDDEEIRISRGNTSHDATLEEYDAWTPSTLMGVNGIEMSQARNDEAMAAGDRPFKKPEDPMKRVKEVVVKRPSQENEIEQNQISMIQADRGKSLKSLDKISLRLKTCSAGKGEIPNFEGRYMRRAANTFGLSKHFYIVYHIKWTLVESQILDTILDSPIFNPEQSITSHAGK